MQHTSSPFKSNSFGAHKIHSFGLISVLFISEVGNQEQQRDYVQRLWTGVFYNLLNIHFNRFWILPPGYRGLNLALRFVLAHQEMYFSFHKMRTFMYCILYAITHHTSSHLLMLMDTMRLSDHYGLHYCTWLMMSCDYVKVFQTKNSSCQTCRMLSHEKLVLLMSILIL